MNYKINQNNIPFLKSGGIHINPKNKGKFTATKNKTGKSTEELTHSKNPLTRKRAVFAQNAKKWKHEEGEEINNKELIPRKALARTFKKMAKHQGGGTVLPDIKPAGIPLQGINIPDKLPMINVPKPEQTKSLSFSDAFKQAKEKGLDKFSWNGKLYTTEMKSNSVTKPEVKDRISASKQVTSPVKETVPPQSKKYYESPNVTVTAKKPQSKEESLNGIKVLPNVTVTAKKPDRVTTIEQARNVLKDRNVVPQNEPKTYVVAEHRGFLENNAEIINTIGNIGAMVLTGSSFKNASNLNRLESPANPNRNVGGYTPSREPISTVRETPINKTVEVAKSTKGITGKTIQQERVASRTIAGKRLPKKHQDGGSIDFLTSLIEQFKRGGKLSKDYIKKAK